MKAWEYVIGKICKTLIPIREEVFFGNKNSSIAICTLSSIDLLKEISRSDILKDTAVAGRLLSENKGIDSIIRFLNSHHNIKTIVLCGKEVWGHKAGHSLLALHKNGINQSSRIINSTSPDPILQVSKLEIKYFQTQVSIIDMIGETKLSEIEKLIKSTKN